ncbi:MAG: tail fiber domain-containing protein [Caulobacteraceae bacterium]|nr:tail fiber domain-containing protein [Caulobacteraceae bacterium]
MSRFLPRVQNGTQISGLGVTTGAEPTFVGSISNHAFIFRTNNTERARIDSSGNLLVGATSFLNYGTLSSYTNAVTPAGRFVGGPSTVDGAIVLMVDKYSSTNTTSQWFLGFTIDNQGVASGVITANGASQAAFGSWSDRRLKENIVDLSPQLENICALRPVEFDYIESEGGGHQISFIAQEFEEVYPDAVGERSDGMKTLTGWDKTTARLVKAIQELKSQFDLVKAELATLKGN